MSMYYHGLIGSALYDPAYDIDFVQVVDYATGANNWQTCMFNVTNNTSSVESVVLGVECHFGPGNQYAGDIPAGAPYGAFRLNNGYQLLPNSAFALVDNWRWPLTPVPIPLSPEPGSLLTLAIGLIGLAGAALRMRA